jgi:DNA topoisomerase-2
MLAELEKKISLSENKLKFILKVVEDDHFLKKDESEVVTILENEEFLKVENTFNYLLNIPVRGCTLNAVEVLKTTILKLKSERLNLETLTINQMWLKELDEVRPYLE